jgi:hypothetical protein
MGARFPRWVDAANSFFPHQMVNLGLFARNLLIISPIKKGFNPPYERNDFNPHSSTESIS